MRLSVWLDPDAADLLDELADAEHDGLLVAAAEELLAEGLAAYAVRKRRRVTE